jgi:histone-lysine N-methyltransferase SETMAR
MTVREIQIYFKDVVCDPISLGTIDKIIRKDLQLRKLSARWVPRILTKEHKTNQMAAALQFLCRYAEEGEKFLSRIVTGDEKWVHYYTPETKEKSKQWVAKGARPPKKAKMESSAGKVMLTCFWDEEGVILEEYAQKGETITKERYFDTLIKLCAALKEKRRGKLSSGIVLLHDNAPAHRAHLITNLLDDFRVRSETCTPICGCYSGVMTSTHRGSA